MKIKPKTLKNNSSDKKVKKMKTLKSDGILINPIAHTVYIKEKEVNLTPKEFALLYLFIKKRSQALNRAFLSRTIWDGKYSDTNYTIDRHIANLRKKLGSEGRRIKTLPTIGYKFKEEENNVRKEKTVLKTKQLWLIWLVIGTFCLIPAVGFAATSDESSCTVDVTNPETREIDTMLVVDAFTITSSERDAGEAIEDPSTDLVVSANDGYKVQAKLSAVSTKFGTYIKEDSGAYTAALTTAYTDIPGATGASANNVSIATTVKFDGLGWTTVAPFANEQVTLNIKILDSGI